jgi:hypothetical protein
MTPGGRVSVVLRGPGVDAPLCVAGRVAWSAPQAPYRVGIAFVEGALLASTRWFDQLLEAQPALAWARRMPSHLPLDAIVYLGRPPRWVVDFSPDEVAVLRFVGSGVTVRELRLALRDRVEGATRAIFSLLARQHLTLARGASVHPEAWRRLLADLEATLAASALFPPPVLRPSPSQVRSAVEALASGRHVPAPAPRVESRAALRRLDAGGAWHGEHPRPGGRPYEAQGCWERALAELAAGRTGTAITLLRRASALAPDDAEIGRTLAEISFRHRADV